VSTVVRRNDELLSSSWWAGDGGALTSMDDQKKMITMSPSCHCLEYFFYVPTHPLPGSIHFPKRGE
jgi:hypothetical protein